MSSKIKLESQNDSSTPAKNNQNRTQRRQSLVKENTQLKDEITAYSEAYQKILDQNYRLSRLNNQLNEENKRICCENHGYNDNLQCLHIKYQKMLEENFILRNKIEGSEGIWKMELNRYKDKVTFLEAQLANKTQEYDSIYAEFQTLNRCLEL